MAFSSIISQIAAMPGASIIAAIVVLLLLRRILLPKPLPGIPYNKEAANSIFGDLPAFRGAKNRREWMVEQAVKHNSPLVQIFLKPFSNPIVLVADYIEHTDLASKRLKEFDRSEFTIDAFAPVISGNQLTLHTHDPQFKKNRELVRDLMSPNFLHKVSVPHVYEGCSRLVDIWNHKVSQAKGRPFDAGHDIYISFLDMIAMAAFGIETEQTQGFKELNHLKNTQIQATDGSHSPPKGTKLEDTEVVFTSAPMNEELGALGNVGDAVAVSVRSPFPKIHMPLYKKFSPVMRRTLKLSDQLFRREVAKGLDRKQQGLPQRSALDHMLTREDDMARKEGRDADYYSKMIYSEVLGYLVAGHETLTGTMKWGLRFLTEDQRSQSVLRDAIAAAFPDAARDNRSPSSDEIIKADIPYLDAVIEEISRTARVAPLVFRDTLVDTHVMGVPIPKGTNLAVVANAPGITRPSLDLKGKEIPRTEGGKAIMGKLGSFDNEDIEKFYPERWLKTRVDQEGKKGVEFDPLAGPAMAFGVGPRACFGRKLAYLSMRIFLVSVFWNFEALPVPARLVTDDEKIGLIRMPNNVFLRLRRVQHN